MREGIQIESFDWQAFQSVIAPPALKTANRILDAAAKEYEYTPRNFGVIQEDLAENGDLEGQSPAEELAEIISSTNWYPVSTCDDLLELHDLLKGIFYDFPEIDLKSETEHLLDGIEGEFLYRLETMIPLKGVLKNWLNFLFPQICSSEYADLEFCYLGKRPFRFDWSNYKNVVIEDDFRECVPQYSVHSPEQVVQMYQKALLFEDSVKSLKKSSRNDHFREMYFEHFLPLLRNTSESGRAIRAESFT
ncbi:MAG: hypothetical protein KDA65_12185 [Planctomycetaceae bacterium]|nr:hypothetical protein [Planctomycetaceae bacterium]